MYNRYIPQPDGTYRRSTQQDRSGQSGIRQNQPQTNPQQQKIQQEPEKQAPSCGNSQHQNHKHRTRTCHPPAPPKPEPCCERPKADEGNVASFFRRLLPREFDTGDLLIVLLILLMAGDCREDQNSALLTLVLYLFL